MPFSILITKTWGGLVDQWVQPLTRRDYPVTAQGAARLGTGQTLAGPASLTPVTTHITWLSQGHWGSWGCRSHWILVFSYFKAPHNHIKICFRYSFTFFLSCQRGIKSKELGVCKEQWGNSRVFKGSPSEQKPVTPQTLLHVQIPTENLQ